MAPRVPSQASSCLYVREGKEGGKEGGSREISESGNNLFIVVTIVSEMRPRMKRLFGCEVQHRRVVRQRHRVGSALQLCGYRGN